MARAAQQTQVAPHPAAKPAHIAIIMDGNGRWAQARGVGRVRGHNQGAEALRALLEACRERPHIRFLTLYAFSTENWNRSPDEVSDLMNLLRHYVKREAKAMHKNGVRLNFIGQRDSLAQDIQNDLAEVEALTRDNDTLTLTIALSYGARQELTGAMKTIAAKVAEGTLRPDAIDEKTIAAHLQTSTLPDPDLLIRTGGDERLSNFLLWQAAYTELYFTEVLWPDFDAAELDRAIACFSSRERRFGKRKRGTMITVNAELITRFKSAIILAGGALLLTVIHPLTFIVMVLVGAAILWKEWFNLTKGRSMGWFFFGLVYIFAAVMSLIYLRNSSLMVLLSLFAIVWVGDIAGYLVGREHGKHKIAPSISPGKSWEGLAASVVVSASIAMVFGYMAPLPHAILGAVLAVIGLGGDMFESWLKRRAGVKDSGTLIPGHGGLFDRVDALLPCAIVAAIAFLARTGSM